MSASAKPISQSPRCAACYYFSSPQMSTMREIKTGKCRRFPPQVTRYHYKNDVVEEYAWPVVRARDWCGEYSEAEAIDE